MHKAEAGVKGLQSKVFHKRHAFKEIEKFQKFSRNGKVSWFILLDSKDS